MKEIDNDQIAWDAFENPAELYRLWKEEENLLAAQFLANKYHWGDESNGIFINPNKAREIYEEIGESYEDWDEQTTCDNNLQKTKFYIWGEEDELEPINILWMQLKDFWIDGDEKRIPGFPVGVLMNLLVGSPWYEGIVECLEVVLPTKLSFRAQLEKPEALLYAFREAFPNLRIVEERQLKTDGRSMKGPIGDLRL